MAGRNVRMVPKTSWKVCLGFVFSVMVICCFGFYTLSIHQQYKAITNDKISLCRLGNEWVTYEEVYDVSRKGVVNELFDEREIFVQFKLNTEQLDENEMDADPLIYYGMENDFNDVYMEIGRQRHYGRNDYSYYFAKDYSLLVGKEAYSIPFSIMAYDVNQTFLTENEKVEYQYKFGKSEYVKGDLVKGEKDIMVSDYMLEKFGVSKEEQEALLGETISIGYGDDGLFLQDYKLCGILDSDVYHLESSGHDSQIVISLNDGVINNSDYIKSFYQMYLSCKNHIELEEKYRVLEESNISLSKGAYADLFNTLEKQNLLANRILLMVGGVLVFFISVMIFTSMYFYYDRRKGYISMLRAIGIRKGSLFAISFLELLWLGLVGFVIALALSGAIWMTSAGALRNFLGIDLHFEPGIGVTIMATSLVYVLAIGGMVAGYQLRAMANEDVAKLFEDG